MIFSLSYRSLLFSKYCALISFKKINPFPTAYSCLTSPYYFPTGLENFVQLIFVSFCAYKILNLCTKIHHLFATLL